MESRQNVLKKVTVMLLLVFLWNTRIQAQELPILHGRACYYADKFHGCKMSNGERYHRDSMTCASLKYPLGTWLYVYAPKVDKTVLVEVTDRGPYSRRYIIDLSRAAAEELGILRAGYADVVVTPCTCFKFPYKYQEIQKERTYHLGTFSDSTRLFFPPDTVLFPFEIPRNGDEYIKGVE